MQPETIWEDIWNTQSNVGLHTYYWNVSVGFSRMTNPIQAKSCQMAGSFNHSTRNILPTNLLSNQKLGPVIDWQYLRNISFLNMRNTDYTFQNISFSIKCSFKKQVINRQFGEIHFKVVEHTLPPFFETEIYCPIFETLAALTSVDELWKVKVCRGKVLTLSVSEWES